MKTLNRKSASPPLPPSPPLRRPAPAPYFQPLFWFFRVPHPGEVIKIYFLPPLKRGRFELCFFRIPDAKIDWALVLFTKIISRILRSVKDVKGRSVKGRSVLRIWNQIWRYQKCLQELFLFYCFIFEYYFDSAAVHKRVDISVWYFLNIFCNQNLGTRSFSKT